MATRANRRRPSRLGQNFLVDRNVARRIVAAAQPSRADEILEIGPGRGALTRMLARSSGKVVAVELDSGLAEALAEKMAERLSDEDYLAVVNGDALEFEPGEFLESGYKLVANLPYYAATPIIRRFLTIEPRPRCMIAMVQKEVAENMAALPGRMGLLSVMVQLYGRVRTLFTVPPTAFRPRPRVSSSVVRIDLYDEPMIAVADADDFIGFVTAGFRAPRKQILNSLRLGLDADAGMIRAALSDARISADRRPATLALPEWGNLHEAWTALDDGGAKP